jgi:hypothetical protein
MQEIAYHCHKTAGLRQPLGLPKTLNDKISSLLLLSEKLTS